MPRLNGLELLRRFRAHPTYETTPFLMITGEVTEEIVAAAAESEVDGYLLKPFKITALESRLRTIILNRHQPSAGEALFRKAKKLAAGQRHQEALSLLQKLLAPPFKKQAKVLNLLGECHLALKSYAAATAFFTQALELNPQYWKACQNLAALYEELGNLAEARRFLEQAHHLSPLNPGRLFRLGQLCLKTGAPRRARLYLQESLNCCQAFLDKAELPEVAEIFLQASLDQATEELLLELIRDHPDNALLCLCLGLALRRQNRHQDALRCYETALALASDNEKVYFHLGVLRFEMGDREKARQAFQTALRLRPGFAEAREFLHHCLPDSIPKGLDSDSPCPRPQDA